jgi:hypothetical protein
LIGISAETVKVDDKTANKVSTAWHHGFYHSYYSNDDDYIFDNSAESRSRVCFPGTSTVETPTGKVPMSSLKKGMMVLVNQGGSLGYEAVETFLHNDVEGSSEYVVLEFPGGKLSLSARHLVFANSEVPDTAVFAQDLKVGDQLFVKDGEGFKAVLISNIRKAQMKGAYAPLTVSGTIVVDDVVASCFAEVTSQWMARWSMLPAIAYERLGGSTDGYKVHPYAEFLAKYFV